MTEIHIRNFDDGKVEYLKDYYGMMNTSDLVRMLLRREYNRIKKEEKL